ncbi:hypothetical protein [Cellulomonas sp. SG140]|uniref:hypothetical protein n=1 Tax=Cellulomonas sp. SG140 TaxID=2976536 RepID=UPI0021E8F9F6|nr:hypothetical protein [Cellulomonas sp. SG140]
MKRLGIMILMATLLLAGCGKPVPATTPTLTAEKASALWMANCIGSAEKDGQPISWAEKFCSCLDTQVNVMHHTTEVAGPACMARYPKP